MTRDDIIRMALEANFRRDNKGLYGTHESDITPLLERFAALVATEVDKNWVQGKAKISVPTATMEQEFNNYHRLGYKAGAAAEREACARIVEREALAYAEPVWAVEIVNDIRARGEA